MTLGVYAKCTPKEITPTTLSESAINEIPFALDNGHGADLVRQLADLGMQGLVEVEATEMIGADRWELLLVTCWCVPEPHIGPHDVSCVYLHPTCVHVRNEGVKSLPVAYPTIGARCIYHCLRSGLARLTQDDRGQFLHGVDSR